MFSGEQSYNHYADKLFGEDGISIYGYYKPQLRTLVMNISTGGGTLVHEIVHPFMATNFPKCPSWFNEGLASLYEQAGIPVTYIGHPMAQEGATHTTRRETRELLQIKAESISAEKIAQALFEEADAKVKYAEQAVKLDPQRPFGHYILGLLYLDTNNFAGAISELESAKRSYTNVPEVYFALGNAYARSGRKVEAARARATFSRLKALTKKESADDVYGEQTSGLTQQKLDAEANGKPPP